MNKNDIIDLHKAKLAGAVNAYEMLLLTGELLNRLLPDYESLDEEAKAYVDGLQRGIIEVFARITAKLADSPQTRKLKRQIASLKDGHPSSAHLLRGFAEKQASSLEISVKGEALIVNLCQHLLDFLFDHNATAHTGTASFAILSLLYWAVDETLLACHLVRRRYVTQAYAHLRTIMEIQDRVQLFRLHPELAEVWASDDSKKIWAEFRPKAVRRKLGRDKEDPLYEFLSAEGSHPTWQGAQSRITKKIVNEAGKTSIGIAVGGVSSQTAEASCVLISVAIALKMGMTAATALKESLNRDELGEALTESIIKFGELLQIYSRDWLKMAPGVILLLNDLVSQCDAFVKGLMEL